MRLCDVGETIQEVMESYEVEIDGKTYQGKRRSLLAFCSCTAFRYAFVLLSCCSEANQEPEWPLHRTVQDTLREDCPDREGRGGYKDGGLHSDWLHKLTRQLPLSLFKFRPPV